MNLEDVFDAQSVVSRSHDGASVLSERTFQVSHEDGAARHLLNNMRPSEGDVFPGPSTTSPTLPPQLLPGFDFQGDLETSLVYRRANRDSMDFSFRSSVAQSHMWSVFSDLSLGDIISNLSVVALPIYADEITNASHYEFGGPSLEVASPSVDEASEPTPRIYLRECLEIESKLSQVSAFRELFIEERSTGDEHPFWVLHRIFQRGYPLMMLFNMWEQQTDQHFDIQMERQSSRAAFVLTYRAISAFSSVPELGDIDLKLKSSHDSLGEITDFLKVGTTRAERVFFPSVSRC